ncbi:12039_t:CDS:2, partial [Dentiscutata erythropus]
NKLLNEEDLKIKKEFLNAHDKVPSENIPIYRSQMINTMEIAEAFKKQPGGIYVPGTVQISQNVHDILVLYAGDIQK